MRRLFLPVLIMFAVPLLVEGLSSKLSAQDIITDISRQLYPKQLIVDPSELHRWERYIRGFRKDHNFAFSAGFTNGSWRVQHLGDIEDRSFPNTGLFTKLQYSFHIPVYKGFGYFLGSSMGYHYEAVDKRSPYQPVPGYQLPGLLAGMTLNVSPVFRISLAADLYMERYEGISERAESDRNHEISITMFARDFAVLVDLFYDLNWGIRLEGHSRDISYTRPQASEGFEVDVSIRKRDYTVGLGIIYHLI